MQLQNNIKLDDLEYTAKRGKRYHFSKYYLPVVFLRAIHEGDLPLKDVDEKQNLLLNELKDMGQGKITVEKRSFSIKYRIISTCKFLNNFKSKIFPTRNPDKTLRPEPAPESTVFATPKRQKNELNCM